MKNFKGVLSMIALILSLVVMCIAAFGSTGYELTLLYASMSLVYFHIALSP